MSFSIVFRFLNPLRLRRGFQHLLIRFVSSNEQQTTRLKRVGVLQHQFNDIFLLLLKNKPIEFVIK